MKSQIIFALIVGFTKFVGKSTLYTIAFPFIVLMAAWQKLSSVIPTTSRQLYKHLRKLVIRLTRISSSALTAISRLTRNVCLAVYKPLLALSFVVLTALSTVALLNYWHKATAYQPPQPTRIYDRNGVILYESFQVGHVRAPQTVVQILAGNPAPGAVKADLDIREFNQSLINFTENEIKSGNTNLQKTDIYSHIANHERG